MASILKRHLISAMLLFSGTYGLYCAAFPGTGRKYTPSSGTPALVQQVSVYSTGSGTTYTVPIAATGSGNLLVIAFANSNTTLCTSSVTDNGSSGGNTYSLVTGTGASDAGGGGNTQIFYATASKSGATTLTINLVAGCSGRPPIVFFAEFTNLTTTDGSGVAKSNATASTTPTAPSITTTSNHSVVVSVLGVQNTVTGLHTGSTFTRFTNVVQGDLAAYQITTSAGTYTATFDQDISGNYCGSTAAFK